ncbi:MAG: ATP synthase F0 subunit B [Dictyoglomus sp. NZ13-RE01]|nr:MAG: ATP synthase F0 subunit B [Dictyoglomus sp. NZ13-RE01]
MFNFNVLTIFSSIVNLLVLAWIIKRYFIGSLLRIMEERKRKIEEAIKTAEEKLKEAEELRKRREERLAMARDEAAKIVDEAVKNADKLRQEIISKAEEEAEKIILKAHDIAKAERKRALETSREEIINLSKIIIKQFFAKYLPPSSEEEFLSYLVDSFDKFIMATSFNSLKEVKLVVPNNVNSNIINKIEKKLRNIIPGNWNFECEEDPSIVLGFKLFLGEYLLDHSLDYHLNQIYQHIRETENI